MYRENPKEARYKAYAFILLSSIFMIMLTYGYYRIQLVETEIYRFASQKNIVREFDVLPTRGDIYDRKKKLIVDNRPAFSLAVNRRLYTRDTILQEKLLRILNDSSIDMKHIYKRKYRGIAKVVIKRQLDEETLSFLWENKKHIPGIYIEQDPVRNFNQKINAAHVLGHVQEILRQDLKKNRKFKAGDIIGYQGLEKEYNDLLFGEKGKKSYVFDAYGNIVNNLSGEFSFDVSEIDGKDLYTSIDSEIQFVAESLLVNKKGSIVALDPRNGEILAMASAPNYKPESLIPPISNKVWKELTNPETAPLIHRAISGQYPPGSVYKMLVALTAVNENLVTSKWQVECHGAYQLGRRKIKCNNTHGKVRLERALQTSCNVYFYQLGLKIGLDLWEDYSKLFLFGSKTGVDLPNEKRGIVPSKTFYERRIQGGPNQGHLANLAIGQGELLVTPLQIAQYTMIIANKGEYYKPHFLRAYSDKDKDSLTQLMYPKKRLRRQISERAWKIVRNGMYRAVYRDKDIATARVLRIVNKDVAAKTGTAQNEKEVAHSWITCFAPFDKPEIVVSVIVENGGSGSAVAGPIARSVLEQYFYGKVKKYIYKPKVKEEIQPLELPDLIIPKINMELPDFREDD